jgi:ATP-dependent exoDNAse (exonuclease V) beta subunit
VWWDPRALTLGTKSPFGLRREELIVKKEVEPHVVAEGRQRYERWRLARQEARATGALPSLRVVTVRDWVARGQSDAGLWSVDPCEVAVVSIEARDGSDADQPRGAAFGVLVHAVLAQAPLDATRDLLEAIASVEARVVGLSEREGAAAATIAGRVLAHELLVRARKAWGRGECRRETPLTLTDAGGTVIEGVVDLAFEEEGRWTIVDYKTDREIAGEGEERYRRQIALYASAVARATGSKATAVLVRI